METSMFAHAAASAFTSARLELTILPTEQCQFRCTYCYEDFAIGKMKPAVVRGVKALIAKRIPELRTLDISWFGGEPLLARDIVRDVMGAAQTACVEYGTNLRGSITTNADLLTSALFEELVDLGIVHYQITLDGPQRQHDAQRKRANGGPTFARIWTHLLAAKNSKREFEIMIRLHISPDNKHEILAFAKTVNDTFLTDDPRFTILPKAVGDWGGPNSGSIDVVSAVESERLVDDIYSMIRGSSNVAGDILHVADGIDICYAAKPNALIIRADGSISKCTVALSNKANSVGRINEDGTLELKNNKISLWHKGWENQNLAQLGCPLSSVLSAPS